MVSLFGTASETCLEIVDRAPYAHCVRCRCARGCHTCEALGVARRARSCGQPAEVQHAVNDALGVCHQRFVLRTAFESSSASKNTPVRVRSAASNWRASTRCASSSASVWREVRRRLGFLLLLGRVARRGMGPVVTSVAPSPLARHSLGGKTCYVLTHCRRSRSSPSAAACAPRSCCSGCREWTSR